MKCLNFLPFSLHQTTLFVVLPKKLNINHPLMNGLILESISDKKQWYKTHGEIAKNIGSFELFCDKPIINWHAGIMLVKNVHYEFIASNPVFSRYSGYDPESLIGLSDNHMPWAEHKGIYINHEKDVISGLE